MPDIDVNTDVNNSIDINIESPPSLADVVIQPTSTDSVSLGTQPLYGPKGEDGRDGVDGQDGFSPIATVTKTDNTATITITDVNGTTTATVSDGINGTDGIDGQDGFSPIANVSKNGNVATISVTDSNGTTTATVSDGADGQNGTDGIDGVDGYSPIATVSKLNDTATITITDKNGTTTATVLDGTNGQNGQDGFSPTATVTKTGNVATITLTDKNGTTTAQISDGAGAVTDVQKNGVSVLSGGVANVIVPTKTSDIANDSNFITSADLATVANIDLSNLSATGEEKFANTTLSNITNISSNAQTLLNAIYQTKITGSAGNSTTPCYMSGGSWYSCSGLSSSLRCLSRTTIASTKPDMVIAQGGSGTSGYRVWSSGFKECWGSFDAPTKTVFNYTVTFSMGNYSFSNVPMVLVHVDENGHATGATNNVGLQNIWTSTGCLNGRTTSSFTLCRTSTSSTGKTRYETWYAFGY